MNRDMRRLLRLAAEAAADATQAPDPDARLALKNH
jgi:hypothetical protein